MSKLILTIEDAVRIIRQQCQLPDWIEVQIGDQQPTTKVTDTDDKWYDVSSYDEVDPPAITKHYPFIDVMYADGDIEHNVTAASYRWNRTGGTGDIIMFRKAS